MKQQRYAILMRASTNKQTAAGKKQKADRSGKQSARPIKEKDTLPEQKTNIMKFIESQPELNQGIKWINSGLEFVEAGVSGFHTHTSKRKVLQEAYESAKRNEYDILIIYKIDRFGRRSTESLNMAQKFLNHCRIWVVDKGAEISTSKDTDEIINFFDFWGAKKASEDTKKRVTDAMLNIHEEGYWTGGNPPYGFENHPDFYNTLKAIPEEAVIVKEIYNLYVNHGFGFLKISSHLNDKGVKSKTGGEWSSHTIRKILINTVYKGHLSYGKTTHVEGEFGTYQKTLKNGEGTVSKRYWEEYDLVGADLWEKAQEIREKRVKPNIFGGKTPSNKATGKGLLVGILKCECGGHMTYSTCSDWADSKRTKKKEPYGIYRCQTRIKKGVAACGAKKATYRVDQYDAEIIEKLSEQISHMLQTNEIEKIRAKTEAATENTKVDIEAVKKEIIRHTKLKNSATEKLMQIMLGEEINASENQLTEIYKAAEAKLNKLEKDLANFESLKSTDNLNEVDMMKLKDYISNWVFIFNHGTPLQKRKLIQTIAKEIIITRDKITIATELEIPKLFEMLSEIKTTASEEIAASLETQQIEASEPFLQTDDSRSNDSTHITGMDDKSFLLSMYSSDTNSKQNTETEIKALYKKLLKAFSEKVKNKMIIGA